MIYSEYNMPIMFSENDTYCNMSKFRNPYNMIFICGFSGSGKSILAKYLCMAHNATLVSLDHIILWLNLKGKMRTSDIKLFDPIIYKYYTDREILINKLVEMNKNRNSFDYGKNIILDYIEWLSNQQNEQFIVDGIQTSWLYNNNKFIVYPFVFKGTSMIKSWIRRVIREKNFFHECGLKTALKWTFESGRNINRIRNVVMLKTTDIYTRKEVYK